MQSVSAMAAVLAIIYVVPFVFYAGASALGILEVPAAASPQAFMLGILVTKVGTAVAFVLLLQLGGYSGPWLTYGAIWFAMFVASEVGDAIAARSTWAEALVGIFAEAVYAPASAVAAFALLGLIWSPPRGTPALIGLWFGIPLVPLAPILFGIGWVLARRDDARAFRAGTVGLALALLALPGWFTLGIGITAVFGLG